MGKGDNKGRIAAGGKKASAKQKAGKGSNSATKKVCYECFSAEPKLSNQGIHTMSLHHHMTANCRRWSVLLAQRLSDDTGSRTTSARMRSTGSLSRSCG